MTTFTYPTAAAYLAAFESILDQLDAERRHAEKADASHLRSQHNAFAKAFANWRNGVAPDYTGSSYLISSASRPIVHRVRRSADLLLCSCEASSFCWHAALVVATERAGEMIEREMVGELADDDEQDEDYSIQYENIPYPYGIGNPDMSADDEDAVVALDPSDGPPLIDEESPPVPATGTDSDGRRPLDDPALVRRLVDRLTAARAMRLAA
jgi:hypothetical protein